MVIVIILLAVDCAPEQIVPNTVIGYNDVCTFTYFAPSAKSVSLVGNFNNWDSALMSMKKDGRHIWVINVRLPEGIYYYQFVVDNNRWVVPPHAHAYASDGFGGKNGILIVGKGLKQVKE